MRQILLILLCLASLAGAKAQTSFEIDNLRYTVTSENEVSVAAANFLVSGEITIPETVQYAGNTYTVTALENFAFSYRMEITGVNLPETLISIESFAFQGCTKLSSITVPNSVSSIGEYAFYRCTGLNSVLLPNQLIAINRNTFGDCGALTSIDLPACLAKIGSSAFSRCSSLSTVEIPSAVTEIGDHAFYDTGIISITIPNSVTGIGEAAFSSCTQLRSISLSGSLRKMENNLFSSCTNLEEVTIPASVSSIGNQAFMFSGLKSVILPESLESIGDLAFCYCKELTSVYIPAGVNAIGVGVFEDSGIETLTVDPGNMYYCAANGALYNKDMTEIVFWLPVSATDKNFEIPYSVTKICSNAFWGCTFESVTIPETVLEIDIWGFANCPNLKTVTIPASVTTIGMAPFTQCGALTAIDVDPGNQFYSSRNGVLYNKSKTELIQAPGAITECIVAGTVTTIKESAFKSCGKLKTVLLPASVSEIGSSAFHSCSSLASIAIPNKVSALCDKTFSDCSKLATIILPNALTSIGQNVFSRCSSLQRVVLGDKVEQIDRECFSTTGLKVLELSAAVPPAVTGVDNYLNLTDATQVIVPSQYLRTYRAAETWRNINLTGAPYLCHGAETTVLSYEANTLSGIQFDVEIPNGVEIDIPAAASGSMTVQTSELPDNKIRYIAYTTDGRPLATEFTCSAKAENPDRSTLSFTNIITSVDDLPISRADVNVPVLGYALEGFTLPDVDEGETVILDKPEQLDFEDVSVEWTPYNGPLAELSEDGTFTALAAGTIDNLAFSIDDPLAGDPIEAVASIVIRTALGDADGSGSVDIADVVAVVNYILMRNPDPFVFSKADVDGSGDINIADVTRIIKIVLSQPKDSPMRARKRALTGSDEVKLDGRTGSQSADGHAHIYISISTLQEYTALQLDVQLSPGVEIAGISAGSGAVDHILDFSTINESTTRIVLYSTSLAQLTASDTLIDVALASGDVPADALITTSGLLCVEPDGNSYTQDDAEANISQVLAGIAEANAESCHIKTMDGNIVVEAPSSVEIHVFDMQGRAVGSWHGCGSIALEPGVYIVSAGAAQPRKVRIN